MSQDWLRHCVERWAADELPRDRGDRPHATVRQIINAATRLSAHLHTTQDGRGQLPADLGRPAIESFLHHLAHLKTSRQLPRNRRMRICQDVGRVLSRIRVLGLTAAGKPAAGLTPDFMLTTGDIPGAAEPPEPSRDLPPEIMSILTARLDHRPCGPEIRTGSRC